MSDRPNFFDRHPPNDRGKRYSVWAGRRFSLTYRERGNGGTWSPKKTVIVQGRLVDIEPVRQGDKIVGVTVTYRPGRFDKNADGTLAWKEEDRPGEQFKKVELGPFASVSHVKAELVIDEIAEQVEHNRECFVLDAEDLKPGSRQAQFVFMV